jgi:DNA-binding NarL/FixJ family response regulator
MTRTVLIVDDHPSFRASARMLLESEGFEVIGEAEDGESALRAVEELRPDVGLVRERCPVRGFIPKAELSGAALEALL